MPAAGFIDEVMATIKSVNLIKPQGVNLSKLNINAVISDLRSHGKVNPQPDTEKSTKVHIGESVNQSEMITNDNTEGVVNPEKPDVQDLTKLNPDEMIFEQRIAMRKAEAC